MIIAFIIITSVIQVVLYWLLDRIERKYVRLIAFITILIGHFFIFPNCFYAWLIPDHIDCGMPYVGITLVFWVFGGGLATITHILYHFISKKNLRVHSN